MITSMDKQWSSMTDRERDAALAEAMGDTVAWRLCEREPDCGGLEEIEWWYDAHPHADREGLPCEPCILRQRRDTHDRYDIVPTFTTSLDAMRDVEDEIEKRGLQEQYVFQLEMMLSSMIPKTPRLTQYKRNAFIHWLLLRATPTQRAEAAYRVLTERQGRS